MLIIFIVIDIICGLDQVKLLYVNSINMKMTEIYMGRSEKGFN